MPRSPATRPDRAIVVTTYAELEAFVRAFADGHLGLLLLVGSHGLAKSRTVREALGEGACWIEGQATAFGLYRELHRHRDEPVVLDDIDGLFADRESVRLLKAVCQTEEVKSVAWHTTAAERAGLPDVFQTRSRVVLIANEWRTLNANVAAVEDRGHTLAFEPTPLEVHRKVASWFWDNDIYNFIGERLGLVALPTMREYLRAWELKRAGLPWRDLLLAGLLSGSELLAAQIKADPSFASEADRVRAFIERGGGCKSSYYNALNRLPPPVVAPA